MHRADELGCFAYCRCSSSLPSSEGLSASLLCGSTDLCSLPHRHCDVSAFLECSNLDTSGKESVDKQDVATSLASQGVGTYDQVRETLKEVQVDATSVASTKAVPYCRLRCCTPTFTEVESL
jgi:hypothetical protein